MTLEFSLSLLVLATALTALAYRFWPRIAVRTHAESHGGIGIREVAVSIWRPRFSSAMRTSARPATYEFVIYLTLRSCNQ